MKKLVILLAMTSLVVGSAFALSDDGENSLGVYFDQTYDSNCMALAANQTLNAYWVLANCEFAAIGGFEFQWGIDPAPAVAPIITSLTLPPQALNIGDQHNLIVGIGTPYATSEATVLATVGFFIIVPFEGFINVGPSDPASIAGHCAFNDAFDVSHIVPMNFSTVDGVDVVVNADGWVVPGVGQFSNACAGPQDPVATETTNWGSMKSLFQ